MNVNGMNEGHVEQSEVLRQLTAMLHEKFPDKQADQITDFAMNLLGGIPAEELTEQRVDDLCGSAVASWEFVKSGQGRQPRVRVYNPEYESHGWQTSHTVIEVVCPNMPFVVDSVRMALTRRNATVHRLYSTTVKMLGGESSKHGEADDPNATEMVLHIEIDRLSDRKELKALESILRPLLGDIKQVVDDFGSMKQVALDIRDRFLAMVGSEQLDSSARESAELINWMLGFHFTFVGYQAYRVSTRNKHPQFKPIAETRLGWLSVHPDTDMLENTDQLYREENQLVAFAKSADISSIHRNTYPEIVIFKEFDKSGRWCKEHRFLGHFTAKVYHQEPCQIPWVERKVRELVAQSGIDMNSYEGRQLAQLIQVHPREELFLASTDELYSTLMGVLHIQERRQIRAFVRMDPCRRFVSCLIYVPKEDYSTSLRIKFEEVLEHYIPSLDKRSTTFFSESALARAHILIRVDPEKLQEIDIPELERELVAAAKTWEDALSEAIHEAFGEEQGGKLSLKYRQAFSAAYREEYGVRHAVIDINRVEQALAANDIVVSFYRTLDDGEGVYRFKVFNPGSHLPLSDVLPVLENMNLRVLGESSSCIRKEQSEPVWMHDFKLFYETDKPLPMEELKEPIEETFLNTWKGHAENDGFNRLTIAAGLTWRQVAVFRAYAKYMKQIGFQFSQHYIEDALIRNPKVVRSLDALFEARFNPATNPKTRLAEKIIGRLNKLLNDVQSLDEDRILKRYMRLILATLRTNFYQPGPDGRPKEYLAYKMDPVAIPELPKPVPKYEIFVYSPIVEGVHLRGGKVARGGLRWSDRREDFRTEILGLVKAQQVKNSVIVPAGAKGGFIAKHLQGNEDRDEFMRKGIEAYQAFISGLLDITDNLVNGQVVPPDQVVRHDDDDPYLVVAADKGTATFSDIANALAESCRFWLGDAFASGGSNGYDHKKMGITAKGAWVSVQRHFREMGIDVQNESVTVAGIGDMAGDVFGNGMLLSSKIQLVAAFNHAHIFIDPNPDPETSYKERYRLFHLPRSSWEDYDRSLLSPGGEIYDRRAKVVTLSPEAQSLLGVSSSEMTPNELIMAILKSRVDLIWNGGIGTYVKASVERHNDVGDKANDGVRINASELNCKVIGEGGNLGLTQLARVEYALKGGRCNTDFIDNAGGVDCSDHEVNIKILLNKVVEEGDMTTKQRDRLLADMTDTVSELVLHNNYRQVQAISLSLREGGKRTGEYQRFIQYLEDTGRLDRALEFIPDDETLLERADNGQFLTRPEISVLVSYAKSLLKDKLADSPVMSAPYLEKELETAFPEILTRQYGEQLAQHQLKKQIIATQVANALVNYMGPTFCYRMRDAAGSDYGEIAKAFITARDIFSLDAIWSEIEALDYEVPAELQLDAMNQIKRLVRRSTRWLLRNYRRDYDIAELVKTFHSGVNAIFPVLTSILPEDRSEACQRQVKHYTQAGFPETLAQRIALSSEMYSALGMIAAAERSGYPATTVAEAYYQIGRTLSMDWFASQLDNLAVENHWQALAREAYRDDLDWQQRSLTCSLLDIMETDNTIEQTIAVWKERQSHFIERWEQLVKEIRATDSSDYSMFAVALRELLDLAQATQHSASQENS